ncbi:hypothetical protein [Orbus mooreae]|uniref:hypothetical protein n=1 Tax=Orbus mooreae TaxID=3074107 RepID=UPI00370DD7F5
MNLTKIINETNLTEIMKENLRQKFIQSVNDCGLHLNLTFDIDSNELNNWIDPQTKIQFNLYISGVCLNQGVMAAHYFGLIAGDVHDALDDWDEEGLGMANELLFYINDLYVKYFGIGFMTIVETKPDSKKTAFTVVH